MTPGNDLCVVIAARNEAENIEQVVKGAQKWGAVIVVDNASQDGTAGLARACGAIVLEHKIDTHIKQSYVDGFHKAMDMGYIYIVQLDAGLSFNPDEVGRFLSHPWAGIVIGQRERSVRKLISRMGGLLTRIITGLPFKDATSGFRLWKTDVLRQLDLDSLTCRAHGFQIELLWRAWKSGFDIAVVPVSYDPGTTSANHVVALEAFRAVLKMNRWGIGR